MITHKASGGRASAGNLPRPRKRKLSPELVTLLVALSCILTQGAMTYLAAQTVSHKVESTLTEITTHE